MALALFTAAALIAARPATAQTFTEINANLVGVYLSSVAWGDYDNDGHLDLLLAGYNADTWMVGSKAHNPSARSSSEPPADICRIYRNNGTGLFTDIGANLLVADNYSVAWGDYDNDGDLDILATGSGVSKIYRNDGGGVFTDIGAGLMGVLFAYPVSWGDVDNDGDLDILLTGLNYGGFMCKIYRNDGGGVFTDIGVNLVAANTIARLSAAWGDYDNDGDLDILVTGTGKSKIYRNNGGGVFTDINANLAGVHDSSVAWGDYDNDGDLDILLTGYSGNTPISKVYRNDGGGVFTNINAGLTGVAVGSVAWGDCDNDGDLDILLAGHNDTRAVSKVYRNDGGGAFTDIGANLTGVTQGPSVAWGDYDNDGDLDIVLTGIGSAGRVSKIYRNDTVVANTVPTAPTGLHASSYAGQVTFGWNTADDAQTPAAGLTYNLRVSTTPGDIDVVSPMASTADGLRRVPTLGKVNHGTRAFLSGLPIGSYYWSVQAIDTAFAGSPFAAESSFSVVGCTYGIDPTSSAVAGAGGRGSVAVSAPADCAWIAVSNATWITVTSGGSGTGNGTLTYSVAANTGAARSATIIIGGRRFPIEQAAQPSAPRRRVKSGA